jgi:REP element-mobilizing transposase RayT
MGHPPRIPVWLGWGKPVLYFITVFVADRKAVLANDATFNALKKAAAKLTEWKIFAAILMPNHVHVIVAPTLDREAKVGNFSGALKRWIREELSATWKWQPGCFDRLLRSDESLHEKCQYLQENPVRAGLVSNSKNWPYQIGLDEEDF